MLGLEESVDLYLALGLFDLLSVPLVLSILDDERAKIWEVIRFFSHH